VEGDSPGAGNRQQSALSRKNDFDFSFRRTRLSRNEPATQSFVTN
jgi:hypothetical protein